MKSNSSLPKIAGTEKQKSSGTKTVRSQKNKSLDTTKDENDLQSLNDKAKEHPFSNYYKAKNNDPL